MVNRIIYNYISEIEHVDKFNQSLKEIKKLKNHVYIDHLDRSYITVKTIQGRKSRVLYCMDCGKNLYPIIHKNINRRIYCICRAYL